MSASRIIACALAATALACAGCGSPRLVEIGGGWYVDDVPAGRAIPHLYYQSKKTDRVVVDRQIESYRLYGRTCLIYEASRKDGRYLFAASSELTPIAFRPSVGVRWRLDEHGPRLFDTPVSPDERRLLQVESINYGDACLLAGYQPKLHDGWQDAAPFNADRVKSEQTIIDVNGEDRVGNSVLSEAARDGQVVLVDELVRAGADVNAANQAGVSVLMGAVSQRDVEVVRRLVQAGARVNAQDARGGTALMYAARYGKLEIAKFLLANGAQKNLRDDAGRTALVWLSPSSTAPEIRQLRTLLDDASER